MQVFACSRSKARRRMTAFNSSGTVRRIGATMVGVAALALAQEAPEDGLEMLADVDLTKLDGTGSANLVRLSDGGVGHRHVTPRAYIGSEK